MTFEIDSTTSMVFKNQTDPAGPVRNARVRVNRTLAYASIEIIQANGEAMTAIVDAEQLDALVAAIKGGN